MANGASTTESEILLRIHDLVVSYGSFRAVDGLNLTVRAGEIYGFLGRNGAGKTSTIRALMGILKPAAGKIDLLEYSGRRIRARQKQRIGYVSQEQFFYPWMKCQALGNFVAGFYPTWDHAEFKRLLAVLELPPGRRVSHLSGGMRVKLALALALAHRPPILILDEPTAGLDPATRREFLEIISKQARAHNRTTFFSSHLIDEVERVADRVGIVHQGKLRYEGDISTLQESVREVHHPRGSLDPSPVDDQMPTADLAEEPEPFMAEAAEQPPGDFAPAETESDRLQAEASLSPVNPPNEPSRPGFRLPTKFQVLRGGFDGGDSSIVFASPEDWSDPALQGLEVQRLSLEDIFIAMTGETTPIL